jgi:glycosyltransferase involved in cell wall biosynthesis
VTANRRKVLVSAYACEPGRGSEPGVGWNVALSLAHDHEVWVLTRANNRPAIESGLAEEAIDRAPRFVYCDLPAWSRRWKRGGRGVQLYYLLWQWTAYRLAKRLHAEVGFEAVHHLTFGKYWSPSFMIGLGIPFVWGPLGGGESCPARFWTGSGARPFLFELGRAVARRAGELHPTVRRAARQSAAILVPTPDTERRLRRIGARNLVRYPGQTGLSREEVDELERLPRPASEPFRLVAVSRVEHWKGLHLVVRALSIVRTPEIHLDIVGTGPELRSLKKLIRRLDLKARIHLFGALSRADTFSRLGSSQAFIHPSLHDFFPTVCLEAMAAGLPVICLDTGGPAVQVDPATGIRVPVVSPEQVVEDLATAIDRLAGDEALRLRMGAAGRKRVRDRYTWDRQGDSLRAIYDRMFSK